MRKAINPIIATVLIILVTLVAAVSIGGFVIGIFGSSSNLSRVALRGTTCVNNVNGTNCVFQLDDQGLTTTTLTGADLTVNGQVYSGVCPTVSIPEPSIAVSCIFKTNRIFDNRVATGTLEFSNGAILIFTVEFP